MAQRIPPHPDEKKLAQNEAKKLRRAFKGALKQSVNITPGGQTSKATVKTLFRSGRLDRLTFVAPHYVFKQHYGFEGVKSNGVRQRLKATNVLNKAIDKVNTLENLADGLTYIRGEQVLSAINFNKQ